MTEPYFTNELVTLYHGDCREIPEWLEATSLVTDPPYGRDWAQGDTGSKDPRYRNAGSNARAGIANDKTTEVRDTALALWGKHKPAIVFGDLMLAPPTGTKQVLIYSKPPDAGQRGAVGGFRRDIEAVYLLGRLGTGLGGRTSILTTGARNVGGQFGLAARYGHPHAKPVDTLTDLISNALMGSKGTIADPFSGSGSILVAASMLGMKSIGVELEERYCEVTATRLTEDTLFGASA